VQREQRTGGFKTFFKGGLAGLLALLLLAAVTLSASDLLHQSLHNRSTVNGHICLVCSFAKGQAEANDVSFISVIPVFVLTPYHGFAATSSTSDFRFLLSHSRAPPSC
jgi:hypothetical protein